MASPPTDYYVDPSIAGNSGSGTIGDPYGDLQHALDSITRDSTDGDRINIKAGTDEILSATLDYTSYGTPSSTAPLIFQGYTSTQGDGGLGGIDCNSFTCNPTTGEGVSFLDLEIHGSDSNTLLRADKYGIIAGCYLHDTTQYAIFSSGNYTVIMNNRIENVGGSFRDAINNGNGTTLIAFNYIRAAGRDFRRGISCSQAECTIIGNIISCGASSSSDGIWVDDNHLMPTIIGNTVLSSSGTGVGIEVGDSNSGVMMTVLNNYVEGFSGTGGIGYDINASSVMGASIGHNAAYNNSTNYSISHETLYELGDNETLSATGLAKSGSDTYANRFTYFAPDDEGNMRTGGYPQS